MTRCHLHADDSVISLLGTTEAAGMAEEAAAAQQFTLNIKGPSDLKLSVTVPSDATVEQLKEAVRPAFPHVHCRARLTQSAGRLQISKEKEDFPVDQQRVRLTFLDSISSRSPWHHAHRLFRC